jgi:hypothetical protein
MLLFWFKNFNVIKVNRQKFFFIPFHYFCTRTVIVAQLVRALDCGSRGRRFEPGQSPKISPALGRGFFFATRLENQPFIIFIVKYG